LWVRIRRGVLDTMQLSPLLECDPTVCLPEKSKVTRGLGRGWPNFSRRNKSSGHTPTRVIIGILYRIFLHQTPSNRIPAAFRKYSIWYIKFLLHLQRRTSRWTPCLLSQSREITIIGNTWWSRGNSLGISSRPLDLTMRPYD
jgi:hypothetical protein